MSTLSEVRTQIRYKLNDYTSNSFETDNVVLDSWINWIVRWMYNKLAKAGRGYKFSEQSTTAIVGTKSYSLPTDFFSMVADKHPKWVDSEIEYPIFPKPLYSDRNDTSPSRPQWFELQGDNIILYPPPNEANTFKFPYLSTYTLLSNDDDNLPFPDNFDNLVELSTVYHIKAITDAPPDVIRTLSFDYQQARKDFKEQLDRGVKQTRKLHMGGSNA